MVSFPKFVLLISSMCIKMCSVGEKRNLFLERCFFFQAKCTYCLKMNKNLSAVKVLSHPKVKKLADNSVK